MTKMVKKKKSQRPSPGYSLKQESLSSVCVVIEALDIISRDKNPNFWLQHFDIY